ncbi:MAG: type II toxin-antitoxin system RelE/ParE family toxin [Candidatus Pseudobacter hemicellulosilyticus]|uniref:Type II toxin-antitoxin system RelE/ParE family toxin n=1 Tax=Candidatus Pseudobacter hemicellulosilyticus TaxID=3121375 RepID=A0AAJ6BJG7_9BACT|nr:MAG: type II toxin-antitoxin system RelE/ParE family toxin [Pseudobacter sp.]
MIVSIQHKGLKRLWTQNDVSKLPPDQIEKIIDILTLLDGAEKVSDMNFHGSALHALKGNLAGYWSVTVKANWRIIFQFENGNTYLLDYLDYH